MHDDEIFESVDWDAAPAANTAGYTVTDQPAALSSPSPGPGFRQSLPDEDDSRGPHDPKWEGYLSTTVRDPVKELADTKDAYVSYLVTAQVRAFAFPGTSGADAALQTNLPTFSSPNPSARRRFQDFVFLRENLTRDFPACVVPPLPDKHRLGTSPSLWPAIAFIRC